MERLSTAAAARKSAKGLDQLILVGGLVEFCHKCGAVLVATNDTI